VQHDDAMRRARRGTGAHRATEEALVARLQELSTEFAATPDEEFRAATRARLVAMAAVRTPEPAGRRPPAPARALRRLLAGATDAAASRWRSRLTAGLAGAALTMAALGGLLAAAQGARPGDLLYDVKRGGEQTQLALASDSERGQTLLGFASTRLDELGALVGVQPNADAVVGTTPSGGEAGLAAGPAVGLVLTTLHTMDVQTTEGTAALTSRAVQVSDSGALSVLTGWAADQRSGLGELAPAVPAGASSALTASEELVDRVAARSTALERALGCPGGPSTAGTDDLGPLPGDCAPVPPASPSASSPAHSSVPGTASSDSSSASSVAATATAPPAGTTGTTAGPTHSGTTSAPSASSGLPTTSLPPTSAPPTSSLPGLPSLPSLLPSPPSGSSGSSGWSGSSGSAGSAGSSGSSGSSGSIISVSPPVPGLSVCAPPLITIGC
jgi:hypothetical protein